MNIDVKFESESNTFELGFENKKNTFGMAVGQTIVIGDTEIKSEQITGGYRMTVTTANQTETFDILHGNDGNDGETGPQGPKGDPGETGPQGPKGSDATVTAENVKSALGYTPADQKDVDNLLEEIVDHEDDTTIHVTPTEKQTWNGKVDKTALTLDKHTDGLIYIFVDGVKVGNGVELGTVVEGDVIGVVDENNNILLSGALADGDYTLKYEVVDENGNTSYTEIGTMKVGAIPEPEEPEKLGNLADPTSADWLSGSRLASGYGYSKTLEGCEFIHYIPAKIGDVLRVKGLNLHGVIGTQHSMIGLYSSTDKTAGSTGKLNAYLGFVVTSASDKTSSEGVNGDVSVSGDVFTYTLVERNGEQFANYSSLAYIRISAPLMSGYTKDDVVITINEEIV